MKVQLSTPQELEKLDELSTPEELAKLAELSDNPNTTRNVCQLLEGFCLSVS